MPTNILVFDEDQAVRNQVLRLLRSTGYESSGAASGKEALNSALASPPDLFIVGLKHAVMGGWFFVSKLRSYEDLTGIPVIILTPSKSWFDRYIMSRMMRVQGYLSKPVDPNELRATVRANLQPKRKPARA